MDTTFPQVAARLATPEGAAAFQFTARRSKVEGDPLAFLVGKVFGRLPEELEERKRAAMEVALLVALRFAEKAQARNMVHGPGAWTVTKFRFFARKALA